MGINTTTQEEIAPSAEVEEVATVAENMEAATTETSAEPQEQKANNSNINLLYKQRGSFLDLSKGTRTQDMSMQSLRKIIRSSTSRMKTFYKYLKRPTSLSTSNFYKSQNQIRVSMCISAQQMQEIFSLINIER